jgi:hypothetical protein
MGTGLYIQKTIFYIFIQLVTLWSIYHQMTAAQTQNQFETLGLLILTGVFFFLCPQNNQTAELLSEQLYQKRVTAGNLLAYKFLFIKKCTLMNMFKCRFQ